MAYPKEIQDMVKLIPKEHHKNIQKIIMFYHAMGVSDVQNLIKGIIEIPPIDINDWGVYHSDSLDGG